VSLNSSYKIQSTLQVDSLTITFPALCLLIITTRAFESGWRMRYIRWVNDWILSRELERTLEVAKMDYESLQRMRMRRRHVMSLLRVVRQPIHGNKEQWRKQIGTYQHPIYISRPQLSDSYTQLMILPQWIALVPAVMANTTVSSSHRPVRLSRLTQKIKPNIIVVLLRGLATHTTLIMTLRVLLSPMKKHRSYWLWLIVVHRLLLRMRMKGIVARAPVRNKYRRRESC
jgi:hypothetical protein